MFFTLCGFQSESSLYALDHQISFTYYLFILLLHIKTCSPAGLLCHSDFVPWKSSYIYLCIDISQRNNV